MRPKEMNDPNQEGAAVKKKKMTVEQFFQQ